MNDNNNNHIKLYTFFTNLDVKHLWQQNCHVDWLTGVALSKSKPDNSTDSYYTHCSAFAASVCARLNVPMIGPPSVRTEGLANLQSIWLSENGLKNGWNNIDSVNDAQSKANEGNLVIVAYYDNLNYSNGHVAFIAPSFDINDITKIYLCQAGKINMSCEEAPEWFNFDEYTCWYHPLSDENFEYVNECNNYYNK
jgi:hypothetical protein